MVNATYLELNDSLLGKTEVHPVGVLHVEGALVELRHRVVGVQDGHLLVHLPDDEPGQCHAGDGADQLDGSAVVDVAVSNRELLTLGFVVVHCAEEKDIRLG